MQKMLIGVIFLFFSTQGLADSRHNYSLYNGDTNTCSRNATTTNVTLKELTNIVHKSCLYYAGNGAIFTVEDLVFRCQGNRRDYFCSYIQN